MGSSAAHFRAVGRRGVSGLEVRHLPDPAKLRDLAARWAVLGAQLQALATTVEVEADAPPALSGWDWTGQARDAAATAGGHVHDHVNKVAAEVQNMADGLNETAGKFEEEIRKEKAVFIATILSVPIMGASLVADAVFGIFQSVIAVVDALIVNVARYVGVGLAAATDIGRFVAPAIVFGGDAALEDIIAQTIAQAIVGGGVRIDPAEVGMVAGLGAATGLLFGQEMPWKGAKGAAEGPGSLPGAGELPGLGGDRPVTGAAAGGPHGLFGDVGQPHPPAPVGSPKLNLEGLDGGVSAGTLRGGPGVPDVVAPNRLVTEGGELPHVSESAGPPGLDNEASSVRSSVPGTPPPMYTPDAEALGAFGGGRPPVAGSSSGGSGVSGSGVSDVVDVADVVRGGRPPVIGNDVPFTDAAPPATAATRPGAAAGVDVHAPAGEVPRPKAAGGTGGVRGSRPADPPPTGPALPGREAFAGDGQRRGGSVPETHQEFLQWNPGLDPSAGAGGPAGRGLVPGDAGLPAWSPGRGVGGPVPSGRLDGGAVRAPGGVPGSDVVEVRAVRVESDFSVLADGKPAMRVSDVLGDPGGVPVKSDAPRAVNRAPGGGGDVPLTDAKAPAAGGTGVDLLDDSVLSEAAPGYAEAVKDPPPEFTDVLRLAQQGKVPVGGFREVLDWGPAPVRGGDPVPGAGGSARPPSDVGVSPGVARPGEGPAGVPAGVPARAEVDPPLAGSRLDPDPGFTAARAGEVRLAGEPVTPRDLVGGVPAEHRDAVVRRMADVLAERQQMVEEGVQAPARAAVAGPHGGPGGPGHGPDVPPPPGQRPVPVADRSLGLDVERLARGALANDVGMREWLADGGHTAPTLYSGKAPTGVDEGFDHLHAMRADLVDRRQLIVRQAAGGPLTEADTAGIDKIDQKISRLDKTLGFAGPARARDHVIHERRTLLGYQAQLPGTGAGAARAEQIRSRLDELTTQEGDLIPQLDRRLGVAPRIDTTPGSFAADVVPSRADIERELAKVQQLREDLLRKRDAPVGGPEQIMAQAPGGSLTKADTTRIGETLGRLDDPGLPSRVDQPGPKPPTLNDVEARETRLLDQARQVQERVNREHLADIRRETPGLTAQRADAGARHFAAKKLEKAGKELEKLDSAVTPAGEARAQADDAATEYRRIDRQLSNLQKEHTRLSRELDDLGR